MFNFCQVTIKLKSQPWASFLQTSLSCGVEVLASEGPWITGTCRGEEASTLLCPSCTGGANHSVTTSTSSSEGCSILDSFGDGGVAGVRTFCRTTPEQIFITSVTCLQKELLNHGTATSPHLRTCTQTCRGRGRHGNAHPSRDNPSGRPGGELGFLSGPPGSDSELGHSHTMDHIHTHCKHRLITPCVINMMTIFNSDKEGLTPTVLARSACNGRNDAPLWSWLRKHIAVHRYSHQCSRSRRWTTSGRGSENIRVANDLSCSGTLAAARHRLRDTAPPVWALCRGSGPAPASGGLSMGGSSTERMSWRWRSLPAGKKKKGIDSCGTSVAFLFHIWVHLWALNTSQ